MKKTLKIFLYTTTAVLLVFVIGLAVLFKSLPSPREMVAAVRPTASQQARLAQQPQSAPVEHESKSENQQSSQSLESTESPGPSSREELLADFLLNTERPMLKICDHLEAAADSKIKLEQPDIFSALEEAIRKDPNDPFSNAIAIPLRAILRLPQIQEFLLEAESYDLAEDEENLVDKAAFYRKAFAAYQELKRNEEKINDTGKYAYQLYVISQIAKENPALSRDPSVRDFCEQTQRAIAEEKKFSSQEMTEQMLRLLDFAKVSPESIGYESEIKSGFTFEITDSALQIGLGWINKLLRPPPEPQPQDIQN